MRRNKISTHAFDGVALFQGCSHRQLVQIAPHADRLRLPAGRVLAQAGRTARQLIVLVEGTARAEGPGGTGTLVAGHAVAPDAVAGRTPLPATVVTTSEAEVLVVNGPAFRSAVHEIPTLAARVGSTPGAAWPTYPVARVEEPRPAIAV